MRRRETQLVWILFAVVAVEILVTYARIPSHQLYHVSGGGLELSAARALVFLNFPVALVALAVLGLVWERLDRRLRPVAVVAAVLSAAVFWPGVVDQANLDARPVNALAAVGVLLAAALSLAAGAAPGRPRSRNADRARIVAAAALVFVALPWEAADLGVFFDHTAVGSVFQTGEPRRRAGTPGIHPAVHHGHHHGMDGVLLVLAALLLSRALASVRERKLRLALGAYLSLMAAYGLANVANDFEIEQVLKRGWTSWEMPSVLQPAANLPWLGIVVTAAVMWAAYERSSTRPAAKNAPKAGKNATSGESRVISA
jgi:hypothetical protein